MIFKNRAPEGEQNQMSKSYRYGRYKFRFGMADGSVLFGSITLRALIRLILKMH
jgi:hypothetical protein